MCDLNARRTCDDQRVLPAAAHVGYGGKATKGHGGFDNTNEVSIPARNQRLSTSM